MIINANGQTIKTGIPRADSVYRNGVRCAALRIPLPGGVTPEQLEALASGSLTIETDLGEPIQDSTHEGYNTLISHEAVIARVLSASEQVAAAEAAQQAAQQALESARAAYQLEIAETLDAARAGLISVPVEGDPWDASKRYITGDRVTEAGVEYVALQYSRGKAPANNPDFWALVPEQPVYQAWADIVDGTVIEAGTIVTHDGGTWRCAVQHIKSAVYKPKADSSKWAAYTQGA